MIMASEAARSSAGVAAGVSAKMSRGLFAARAYVAVTMLYAGFRNERLENARVWDRQGKRLHPWAMENIARIACAPLLWPAYLALDHPSDE